MGVCAIYKADPSLSILLISKRYAAHPSAANANVHHSPSGFEFGYGGSGSADLALNVCQYYLNSIGYQGEKIDCFDGLCWSLAWVLHQDFKWAFIANAPHEGITIPMAAIKDWFDSHITDDLKRLYQVVEAE